MYNFSKYQIPRRQKEKLYLALKYDILVPAEQRPVHSYYLGVPDYSHDQVDSTREEKLRI